MPRVGEVRAEEHEVAVGEGFDGVADVAETRAGEDEGQLDLGVVVPGEGEVGLLVLSRGEGLGGGEGDPFTMGLAELHLVSVWAVECTCWFRLGKKVSIFGMGRGASVLGGGRISPVLRSSGVFEQARFT